MIQTLIRHSTICLTALLTLCFSGPGIKAQTLLPRHGQTFDLSHDFRAEANPNGPWSYGYASSLDGPLTLISFWKAFTSDNGVPIAGVQFTDTETPGVWRVMGPGTAMSSGGQFIAEPGTVYFGPGNDGTPRNYGVIRFTVPNDLPGLYSVQTRVEPLFSGSRAADAEFYLVHNGQELFGEFLPPGASTGCTNQLRLAPGDHVDFVIGRGLDGTANETGLKVHATLQRLTTHAPPPALDWLLNIDFGIGTHTGKRGPAVLGFSTNDVWNFYSRDLPGDPYHWRNSGSLAHLTLANGTSSSVGLTVENAAGAWGLEHPDPMYRVYLYPLGGGQLTVTLTNLPAGSYDLLLYGHGPAPEGNSTYRVAVGANAPLTQTTTVTTEWQSPVWQEGVQYVAFHQLTVATSGVPLTITVAPAASPYAILAGLQIARVHTSSPRPITRVMLVRLVQELIEAVEDAPGVRGKLALLLSLEQARQSFRHGMLRPGIAELLAFETQVQNRVAARHPEVARQFLAASHRIIQGAQTLLAHPTPGQPPRFHGLTVLPSRHIRMQVEGGSAPPPVIETSTNLIHWEPLPPSPTHQGPGGLFEDSMEVPMRFYRLRPTAGE